MKTTAPRKRKKAQILSRDIWEISISWPRIHDCSNRKNFEDLIDALLDAGFDVCTLYATPNQGIGDRADAQ